MGLPGGSWTRLLVPQAVNVQPSANATRKGLSFGFPHLQGSFMRCFLSRYFSVSSSKPILLIPLFFFCVTELPGNQRFDVEKHVDREPRGSPAGRVPAVW